MMSVLERVHCIEGPEEVNWKLGFALFFQRENWMWTGAQWAPDVDRGIENYKQKGGTGTWAKSRRGNGI